MPVLHDQKARASFGTSSTGFQALALALIIMHNDHPTYAVARYVCKKWKQSLPLGGPLSYRRFKTRRQRMLACNKSPSVKVICFINYPLSWPCCEPLVHVAATGATAPQT